MNKAALDIFDQVSCYRIELGQTLKELIECYSVIFTRTFDVFIDQEQHMQASILEREKLMLAREIDLKREEQLLDRKT